MLPFNTKFSWFIEAVTIGAGSCASELGLKVFCKLKVNWKDFLQKFFAIHFTCSESCALSKVNCKQRKSIGTPISQFSGIPIYRYVSVSANISVIGRYIGFADIANAYRLSVSADKKAHIGGLTDRESMPVEAFFLPIYC